MLGVYKTILVKNTPGVYFLTKIFSISSFTVLLNFLVSTVTEKDPLFIPEATKTPPTKESNSAI